MLDFLVTHTALLLTLLSLLAIAMAAYAISIAKDASLYVRMNVPPRGLSGHAGRIAFDGSKWEVLSPDRAGLAGQPPKQTAGAKEVQPTRSGCIDTAGSSERGVQFSPDRGADDGHAFTRGQPLRQSHLVVQVTHDCTPIQKGFPEVAAEHSARSKPDGLDRDVEVTVINHLDSELTVRVGSQTTLVLAGYAAVLSVADIGNDSSPDRHDLEPGAVSPDRPASVDDTKRCTEERDTQRYPGLKIHISHSSAP